MKLDDDFLDFIRAAYDERLTTRSQQWLDLRDAFYAGVVSAADSTGDQVRGAIERHQRRSQQRAADHD
jgi:hypothetical protein